MTTIATAAATNAWSQEIARSRAAMTGPNEPPTFTIA